MALLKDLISALVSVALLSVIAEAPDPCCLRVTPYHIQALAQRMAQRFTALEYRAQDLRGVFASFQAMHGNVSHRLRYLEMEHAHLSEMVSRLESRMQSLEEEKKMEEYRHRVGYYRAPRAAAVNHHSDRNGIDSAHSRDSHGHKPHLYQFYVRSRGRLVQYAEKQNEDPNSTRKYAHPGYKHRAHSFRDSGYAYVKPRRSVTPKENKERPAIPYVRLRRNDMSIVLPPLRVHLDQAEEPAPDITSQELPTTSSAVGVGAGASHSDPPAAQEESTTNEVPSGESAPLPEQREASSAPVFIGAEASNDSAVMSGGTTPTPLWQLEESADALLQAMSAGDEDDVVLPPPAPQEEVEEDESVSFWAPAEEKDSVEQLYDANARKCANCSDAVTEPSPATNMIHDSTTVTPDTNIKHLAQNSLDSIPSPSDVEDTSESQPTSSDIDNTIPVLSTAKTKTGCQSSSARVPTQNFSVPSPSNETDSLMDFFTANATGNGSACEGSGCEATPSELSDAELQEALRELDALLQRPPASAPPPDPEKLLLKRALKLALAALERTSDACLTLVNFTADAFEGLAAAEGMTGVASEGA